MAETGSDGQVDQRFPPEVRRILDRAGWTPGRDVSEDVNGWLAGLAERFPELVEAPSTVAVARSVLDEFGGLVFDLAGPGRTMALNPFSLYPLPGGGLPDPWNFAHLGSWLGVRLFPIGQYADGRFDIVIDARGRVFLCGEVDLALGDDLGHALLRLAVGEKPPSVSAPDTPENGRR